MLANDTIEIERNSIEMNCIEMNSIEMNSIEMNSICVIEWWNTTKMCQSFCIQKLMSKFTVSMIVYIYACIG
jgi:hypothetical protein